MHAELKAIQAGLQYKEMDDDTKDEKYKGYVNNESQREGVGIRIFASGKKEIGEYHLDLLNGCGKGEYENANSYWGQFKEDEREGYGTDEWYEQAADRRDFYIGQYKVVRHGYGIYRWADGGIYYGLFKENSENGYGYKRFNDGSEYYGQWKNSLRSGEGI